ncbi:ninjurin-2-like [Thrips palmi]|uniref:Ninjurin-2-like n=1 Tax=Thrips palmi TaxID=161013 RepID=A0A6P9ABU4_THRPL|nr:ninjurin-2-like [Thrips palmi]
MEMDTVSGAVSGKTNVNPPTKDALPDADEEKSTPIKPLDANRYATKKTIAQGMLDIALLTANASQLKYILQVGPRHEFYTLMLGLISTSMILQVLVGIMFLFIGALNINKDKDKRRAVILNDIILIMVFIISVTNVVIAGFGIDNASRPLRLLSDERGPYSR